MIQQEEFHKVLYWGPLLFNIFVNDLFLFIREYGVCNFADDNTLYGVGQNIDNVISDLKTDLVGVIEWFRINSLKANSGKFQFMILSLSMSITLTLKTQTK